MLKMNISIISLCLIVYFIVQITFSGKLLNIIIFSFINYLTTQNVRFLIKGKFQSLLIISTLKLSGPQQYHCLIQLLLLPQPNLMLNPQITTQQQLLKLLSILPI
jgi:hypothetical protein